jgi:hypothetical protein
MARLKEIAEKVFSFGIDELYSESIQFYFQRFYASARLKKSRKILLEYVGNDHP